MKNTAFAALCTMFIATETLALTLTHEFTFDDGTANDSVGSLTGTLVGQALISGGLLLLDGDGDFVELSGYAIPTDNRDYSIKIRAQQLFRTPNSFVELISQGSSGPNGMYIGHDPAGNIRLGDSLLAETGPAAVAYPTDRLFHEYLLTSSTTSGTRFYIDDNLVFSSTTYADVLIGGTPTRFGSQFGVPREFFGGDIDYISIYDGILDPNSSGAVIPLPGSIFLLLSGLVGLAFYRNRY